MSSSIYPQQASLALDVIIVGCGLGGLAAAWCLGEAGHNVTVLEAASSIGEIGAGIQITPNLTRLLFRWGLSDKLKQVSVLPEAITFRRWKTGERLGWTKWGDSMETQYDAPYYHIHRADFHKLLHDLAATHMTLRLNSRVVSLSFEEDSATPKSNSVPRLRRPTVVLCDGSTVTADLVIGADGVRSRLRELVVGHPDKPVATGDAAYRAIIRAEDMMPYPALRELLDQAEMTGWIGPGRHIMAYCIRAKKEYNLVMLHPDDDSVESWTAECSVDKMRADFEGWEPRVRQLLELIPSTLNWKLMDRAPLETWVHPEGTVALLGDACHPMLPYRAQGSAMAVEDAAVLGNLFSHLAAREDVPLLLHAYQRLRYTRTCETQADSRRNQHIFHLADSEAQRERDRLMTSAMLQERADLAAAATAATVEITGAEGGGVVSPLLTSHSHACDDSLSQHDQAPMGRCNGAVTGKESNNNNNEHCGNPNQWADKAKSVKQFSYDADAVAEAWWETEGRDMLARAALERAAQ